MTLIIKYFNLLNLYLGQEFLKSKIQIMIDNKIVVKTKYVFIALLFIIIFFYIFNSFYLNEYEILFIDEKLIIDDIYNIWLIDDVFGRYDNVNNNYLKSILIIFTELSYGGDLRYGHLWSNYFHFNWII